MINRTHTLDITHLLNAYEVAKQDIEEPMIASQMESSPCGPLVVCVLSPELYALVQEALTATEGWSVDPRSTWHEKPID